ncbi:Abi family protein [Pectobacterium polaris]|uniref:Abi family protein n=1 Tax=Pectobacterium polaris TaxID=2042057 RepID=UPI001CF1C1E2|nr:Abi family protein [Pectobacterium polaris]MCA6943795.1 Abi family protein [Pectobacterium polaris]MCA6959362.1 Abi family protein [Pectobacterium polaris]
MSIMTQKDMDIVRLALSHARMSTYDAAVLDGGKSALELYSWNAQVSAALFASLQICEVVMRNAVSDALEVIYGQKWPWNQTFETSLPYGRMQDLIKAREQATTMGQVIPELSFYFWQHMFTNRHYGRIWSQHIERLFPNMETGAAKQAKRIHIHDELEHIRNLRNRIAHHEPIFQRDLEDDFKRIVNLIKLKCPVTAQWLTKNNLFTTIYAQKP